MPTAARYAVLKARGKCSRCSTKPARPGRTMCGLCVRIIGLLDRKRKARFLADGKCRDCGGIKDEANIQLCAHCQEINTYNRTRLNHMKG